MGQTLDKKATIQAYIKQVDDGIKLARKEKNQALVKKLSQSKKVLQQKLAE